VGINSDTVRTAGNGDAQDLCHTASLQTQTGSSQGGPWCSWGMPWGQEALLAPSALRQMRALQCTAEEPGSLHGFWTELGMLTTAQRNRHQLLIDLFYHLSMPKDRSAVEFSNRLL